MEAATETDTELRARIVYVAGSTREIEVARADELDAIAWRHNLRRRSAREVRAANGFAGRETQPIIPFGGYR